MSCQQVTRIVTRENLNTTAFMPEDPYVFTETAPTTPPILFNNQKTRSNRLNDTQQTTCFAAKTTATETPATPTLEKALPTSISAAVPAAAPVVAKANKTNTSGKKTQASTVQQQKQHYPIQKTLTKSASEHTAAQNTKQQQASAAASNNNKSKPKNIQKSEVKNVTGLSNAQNGIPRFQEHQHQQHYLSPPVLSHTPSLWQTPLLLEKPVRQIHYATTASGDVAVAASASPMVPVDVATKTLATHSSPAQIFASVPTSVVTPISLPTITLGTMVEATPAIAANGTMIPLLLSSATPLPPSKFHNTTLAEHLQKLECLKKKKANVATVSPDKMPSQPTPAIHKPNHQQTHYQMKIQEGAPKTQAGIASTVNYALAHLSTRPPAPLSVVRTATPSIAAAQTQIQAINHPNTIEQHSITDLNEIPVNVIFRSPPITINSVEINKSDALSQTRAGGPASAEATPKDGCLQSVVKATTTNNSSNITINVTTKTNNNKNRKSIKTGGPQAAKVKSESKPRKPSSKATIKRKTENSAAQHQTMAKANVVAVSVAEAVPAVASPIQMPALTPAPAPPLVPFAPPPVIAAPISKKAACKPKVKPNEENNNNSKNNNNNAGSSKPLDESAAVMPAVALKERVKRRNDENVTAASLSQKRNKKLLPISFGYTGVNNCEKTISSDWYFATDIGGGQAVAVVQSADENLLADNSSLADPSKLPYCSQKHWLTVSEFKAFVSFKGAKRSRKSEARARARNPVFGLTSRNREIRIAVNKNILRRQALQLLTARPLQKLPYYLARRRLVCVDRLLRKHRYGRHSTVSHRNKCKMQDCCDFVLEMSEYCSNHIVNCTTQYLFQSCNAKNADDTPCRTPVFDINYNIRLCEVHQRLKNKFILDNKLVDTSATPTKIPEAAGASAPAQAAASTEISRKQAPANLNGTKNTKSSAKAKAATTRKKPTNASTNESTISKIESQIKISNPIVPTESFHKSSLQRKNSTTSLESIASNSYSSNISILPPPAQQQQHQQQQLQFCQTQEGICSNPLAPPALAPLSSFYNQNADFANHNLPPAVSDASKEINQLVAQFAMAAAASNANHASNSFHGIDYGSASKKFSHHSNSASSLNYVNLMLNTNSNSNLTSSGIGSTSSLPSTDELLTQDMISVCENSSAYASSEDTGLGELSESELIAAGSGSHDDDNDDVDEIPLGDTRLLEENDLANVLSTLPVDAFNELFTAVRQDECEEVDRALEIADKHLKTLQQTIGSESTDFFGDFLDDPILSDTDICSKMGIIDDHLDDSGSAATASALYFDNACNANSANGPIMPPGSLLTNALCGPLAASNGQGGILADLQMLQT